MRTVVFLLLLFTLPAAAHDADIVYAQASRGEGTEVAERLTLTAATLALLAPLDAGGDGRVDDAELERARPAIEAGVWAQVPLRSEAGPCRLIDTHGKVHETFVALQARFDCAPGELLQEFRILSVLPSNYKVVLGTWGDGELRSQSFAQGGQQTLVIPDGTGPSQGAVRGIGTWFALGVEHIFAGIDHLAFLFALLLVGGTWRRVLLLVTSFTVAHSITLGASALELIRLSAEAQTWVEIAIAVSIVWVALENLLLRTHRHRALLTFGFGLVHGFGFAGVLRELGLGDDVVPALAGFNLGVEAGQAVIVLALLPLVRLVARRPKLNEWTLRLGSGAILAAGAFWTVTRAFG